MRYVPYQDRPPVYAFRVGLGAALVVTLVWWWAPEDAAFRALTLSAGVYAAIAVVDALRRGDHEAIGIAVIERARSPVTFWSLVAVYVGFAAFMVWLGMTARQNPPL